MSWKRKPGTPWEIDGVYCDPVELTAFIHYSHYEHLQARALSDKPAWTKDKRLVGPQHCAERFIVL